MIQPLVGYRMLIFYVLSDSENGRKSRRKNRDKQLLDYIKSTRVFRVGCNQLESVAAQIIEPLEPLSSFCSNGSAETIGKSALQPTHSFHKIGFFDLQCQMIMITHYHISMQFPLTTLCNFKQRLFKRPSTFSYGKQILAIVPPRDDMIRRSRVFNSNFASHSHKIT